MTSGHALTIFGILLIAVMLAIAGLIALVVGVIMAGMWISVASAALYCAVSRTQTSAQGIMA